jgi:CHASE3 domain sensor protein
MLAYTHRRKMELTIKEKINVIEEKIREAERTIRYVRNPSDEELEAQILTGTREQIAEQVKRQTQAINLFNQLILDLKSIDQTG